MYYRAIRNDAFKSKAITLTTMLFVAAAAMLVVLAALLAEIHRTGTTILRVTHDVRVAAKSERVLFIFDGKIAGEHLPGTYRENGDGLKTREEELTAWLAYMKF